jgi:hypothetical protein
VAPMNPLLAGVEQLLLLLFIAMTLASVVGVNPGSVLTPVLGLTGRLLIGLAGLLCSAIAALFKVLLSLFPVVIQSLSSNSRSSASRRLK